MVAIPPPVVELGVSFANVMKKKSKTDLDAIDAMTDSDINVTDSPPLEEDFLKNAELRLPVKKDTIAMRLDPYMQAKV